MFSFFKKPSQTSSSQIQKEVLSEQEIQDIAQKIRNEYKKYAKNNPVLFNLSQFEKRYELTISSKGNVSLFLNEELKYFLELKKKYYLIQTKENQTAFTQISENFEKQIKNYPLINFHPLAKKEIKYFLGAIKEIIENELVILEMIFKGTSEYYEVKNHLLFIEDFGKISKNQYSKQITDYILLLNQKKTKITNSLIEKNTQMILKTVCFELKKITDCINSAIVHKMVSSNLKIKSLNIKRSDNYFFLKFSDAAEKVIENIFQVIKDFRMDKIVGIK